MRHVSIIFHQIYNQFITLCNFSLITIFESNFLSNRKICIIHLYIIYVLFPTNKNAEFIRKKEIEKTEKKKEKKIISIFTKFQRAGGVSSARRITQTNRKTIRHHDSPETDESLCRES